MGVAKVAVVMGSDSDYEKLEPALATLKKFDVPFTVDVISAHRTPTQAHKFANGAEKAGYKVIIAAAGGAAHLAGVIASLTILPVIGVPIPTGNLNGLDSLLSTVQMPSGVPVATVAIGAAANAAILAVQILATADDGLRRKLVEHKKHIASAVITKNKKLKADRKK